MVQIRLTVVGDGVVGKTSLLLAYMRGHLDKMVYTPTVFEQYTQTVVTNGKSYEVVINDTTGQEGYDKLRQILHPETDIFLLCYDVTNDVSYENCKTVWIKELRECVNRPIVLVGCKMDLDKNRSKTEILGKDLQKSLKASKFFLTSAITGEGVKDAIEGSLMCSKSGRCKIL